MKEQDLLSIREFAALTGIKQTKLRYYDEIGLFKPLKRGENGYRYYSVIQSIMIRCVTVMQSLKIPVKEFIELRKKGQPEQILDLLRKHELELNQELFRLQQAYAIIHTYSQLIQTGLQADEQNISVQWMPAAAIEPGSINDFSSGYFYDAFYRFLNQIKERKIDAAYPVGGYYVNMDAFVRLPGKPSRFFSLVPTGRETTEAGEYLVGYTRGYYGNPGDLPRRMPAYAEEHGWTFSGPVYETYLHDALTVENPDLYLIQVSAQVKKAT
ncbi:MAG: MerR family DNA-binding transcriptional regulator [Oscillospiraceae bacterium]|nr:MerR family DNA-binding transcriptional regulator [Oscillospiraceae bacterium]